MAIKNRTDLLAKLTKGSQWHGYQHTGNPKDLGVRTVVQKLKSGAVFGPNENRNKKVWVHIPARKYLTIRPDGFDILCSKNNSKVLSYTLVQ